MVFEKVKNSYCVAELEEIGRIEQVDEALRAIKRLDRDLDNVQEQDRGWPLS